MKRTLILISTILASGLAFLMGGMVSVALPTIQSDLSAGISQMQWVLNSFALALASLILLGGAAGDHYGKRRLFLGGIAVFVLGSVSSALSPSLYWLIASQGIMGIGAAFMVPQSLAILNDCFNQRRGRAIGLWAGFSGGIAALGPLTGGWLVETLGWRSVFWALVPLGIAAFMVALHSVPKGLKRRGAGIDWAGSILILMMLSSLSFILIQGPAWGWLSIPVIVSYAVFGASVPLFIMVESRSANPLLPLKMFSWNVSTANLATLLIYLPLNTVIIFLIIFLQQVAGYSPTQSGLAIMPSIVIITLFSWAGGSLVDRFGPRIPMTAGSVVVSISMFLFSIIPTDPSYALHILPPTVLLGIGMAIIIAPVTKTALSVKRKHSGTASGLNNAVSRFATLMAIALMGSLLSIAFSNSLDNGLDASSLSESDISEIKSHEDMLAGIETSSLESSQEAEMVVDESFRQAFSILMVVSGIIALSAAFVSILFRD